MTRAYSYFKKLGQNRKVHSTFVEGNGQNHNTNWLMIVLIQRLEHESSSYNLNTIDPGRKY